MSSFPANPPALPTPAPINPAPSPIIVAFKTPFNFFYLLTAFFAIYVVAPATLPPTAEDPIYMQPALNAVEAPPARRPPPIAKGAAITPPIAPIPF